jgi:hypothetical protein
MGSFFDAVLDVGAGIIEGVLGDDDPDPKATPTSPNTKSGESKTATDILFDEESMAVMKNFSEKLAGWGDLDRSFLEDTYRPFQEDLISTNTQLINMIGKNSNLALEQSIKDLTDSGPLKAMFRQATTDLGSGVTSMASKFAAELEKIPTTEQRIGQAASAVEQQFGKAAADIRGRLKAQGLNVSQATERDLAIQKATAKAGAVGAAGEASRRERTEAYASGAGVFQNLQTSQSQQLLAQQQATQQGVGLLPQIGGVTEPGMESSTMAKDLIGAGALTARGKDVQDKSLNITEQGVTAGNFPGLDGGKLFNDDGSLTDTGSQLEGKLSPEELNQLREYENNKFEGGTGADDGTTVKDVVSKETWDTIKSVAPNLIGGAVGIFAGPVAGLSAQRMADKYMGTGTGGRGDRDGGGNFGGGGMGGGRSSGAGDAGKDSRAGGGGMGGV